MRKILFILFGLLPLTYVGAQSIKVNSTLKMDTLDNGMIIASYSTEKGDVGINVSPIKNKGKYYKVIFAFENKANSSMNISTENINALVKNKKGKDVNVKVLSLEKYQSMQANKNAFSLKNLAVIATGAALSTKAKDKNAANEFTGTMLNTVNEGAAEQISASAEGYMIPTSVAVNDTYHSYFCIPYEKDANELIITATIGRYEYEFKWDVSDIKL